MAQLKNWADPDYRARLLAAAQSPERRAKIAAANRGPNSPRWKGDAARTDNKHQRAVKLYSLDGVACEAEGCENPAEHRHHRDRDPGNNERSNIEFLCAPCHRAEHAKRG
ncbi:MAG: hypothetical protein ACRDMH_13195 [Solirubrobacterales bacterium]